MLIVALLVLGFGGIVAQTVLLREMLILFSGNELTLSLVIASWVVSEALGAFVAGVWAAKRTVHIKMYTWATLLFSAAFRDIALKAGLHYAYTGNVPGGPGESTYCPGCKKLLIKRVGYSVLSNEVKRGKCKFCGAGIKGLWAV